MVVKSGMVLKGMARLQGSQEPTWMFTVALDTGSSKSWFKPLEMDASYG